ncbi:MAG: nuclear transport factor 2 family protein [Acidimicrobiia bacterium]
MTEDNVALAERLYAALGARDIPTLLEILDDGIEAAQTPELPWGGKYHGHDGMLIFFGKLLESINSVVTTERFFAAGDQVVQMGRTAGTVVATGAPFDVAEVHIWTFRNGKAVRFDAYIDTPAMLEALAVGTG